MNAAAPKPPPKALSARTIVASVWVVGAQFVAKFADFLTLLVLARFLSPQDFGLVAMAMTAVLVTEAITELPLMQALVRAPELTPPMLDTAFTLSLLRGALIATVLIALSWPMARFFEEPRIQALSCVLAFAPVLRGLVSPGLATPIRALDFHPEFLLIVAARVSTLVVASAVAIATTSYWAIAVGTLLAPTVHAALSYVFYPYRPRLSLGEWPLFADVVGWNSVSQVFSATSWQMGRVILGRVGDAASLGFYTMAATIVALPEQAILKPLTRPLMSAFSDSHRRGVLRSGCLRATYALFAVGAPCLLTLAVLARPIVVAVLGAEWEPSAALVRWEALAVLVGIPAAVMPPLAMCLDRTRSVAARQAIQFALLLPLMLLLVPRHGALGLAYARFAAALVIAPINALLVRRLVGPGLGEQALTLWRPACALVPMFVVLWAGENRWLQDAHGPQLAALAGLVGAAGCATYGVALMTLWHFDGRPRGPESSLVEWLSSRVRTSAR